MPTEHLVILMDLSNVLDVVGQGNDAHFSHLMALSGEPVPDGLGDLAINQKDVWIDERGLHAANRDGDRDEQRQRRKLRHDYIRFQRLNHCRPTDQLQ